MSLKHLVVPEYKNVLKTKHEQQPTQVWVYVKGTQEPMGRTPNGQIWNNLRKEIKWYWIITQHIKQISMSPYDYK